MLPSFEPAVRDRVEASFARQSAMTLVGARLLRVEPGVVELGLDYRHDLTQQHGYVHAGVISMLADTAGGYAGQTVMPEDATVLTVEFKINLLAPAEGERFVARGEVVKAGRNLVVTRAEVRALRGETATVCAVMQQTLMTMRGRAERAVAA